MKTAVMEPDAVAVERSSTMADLAELVKARLTFLVLVTAAVGFYAGWQGPMNGERGTRGDYALVATPRQNHSAWKVDA